MICGPLARKSAGSFIVGFLGCMAAPPAMPDCGLSHPLPIDENRFEVPDDLPAYFRDSARLIEVGHAAYAAERLERLSHVESLNRTSRVWSLSLLALARSQLGQQREARKLADSVLQEVEASSAMVRSELLPGLASVYLREGIIDQGAILLQQVAQIAATPDARLRATVNLARAPATAAIQLERAREVLDLLVKTDASRDNRRIRLVGWQAVIESGMSQLTIPHAISALYDEASADNDPGSAAQVLGLIGEWHLRHGLPKDAATAAERAIAMATAIGEAPAVDWLWVKARALSAARDPDSASAYRAAVARANDARPIAEGALLGVGITYRQRYGELFLEYADVLLKAAPRDSTSDRRAALESAVDVIELSKAAEVTDYFRDPCLAPEPEQIHADVIAKDSAIVYPVMFPDRMEILVSYRGGIEQTTVPIGRVELTRIADRFRELVEKRTTRQFLRPARELDDVLIHPIEPLLARLGIKVLIVVPDGALRTIPFAALHDGRQYLVERYAIAILPGVNLTNPRAMGGRRVTGIVEGLTVARYGFPALDAAGDEIDRVSRTLSTRPIRDKEFTRLRLEQEIRSTPADVVHIASHGNFSKDPTETFLLTYDGKVDLDALRMAISAGKVKDEPLELLTLSACETAVGDERAALGLAGVALRAGARSALASLWSVNDRSTAVLTERFYTELVTHHRARAEALRLAQLELLHDDRYAHPAYWAAFVLIGSWL